jgi:anti-sigma regulatory factor (Ser/Thr protein kinase)
MDAPDISTTVIAEQSHLRLPTRPDWIEAAVEYAKDKAIMAGACQESRAGKLVVALHEALTNAMVHGNLELSSELKERADGSFAEALAARLTDPVLSSRGVDVVVDYDGQRCRWIITDEGRGFNVEKALARAASEDPEIILASGRGIVIMRSFMDDVRFELGGKRVVLTMTHASGQEKRGHDRQTFGRPLQVVPVTPDGAVDWSAAYEAMAQNISRGGLNLLQDRLTATSRIIVGLPTENSIVYVPAEVRHVQTLAGNVVEIGCRFQSTPEQSRDGLKDVHVAVESILESLQLHKVDYSERRAHPRLPLHQRLDIRIEGKPPVAGFGRNLSKGGLAFWSAEQLPVVECTIGIPKGSGPLVGLRARICRCTKVMDGLYDNSAVFLAVDSSRKA